MEKKFVDTNVFIYILFTIDAKKQEDCVSLFNNAEKGKLSLWTTPWVIAELYWFLLRRKIPLPSIKQTILKLLSTKGLEVDDRVMLLEALEVTSESLDFLDAINLITAKMKDINIGYSYDKGLDSFSAFNRIVP